MLLKALIVALAAPLLAFGKVVISGAHYNGNGTVTLDITEYTDAPSTFSFSLVNPNGTTTTVVSSVKPESGVYYVTLPSVPAGSYKIAAVDPSGAVLSTSGSFTIGATDFSSTVTAGGYSATSTGSAIPFLSALTTTINGTATVESITISGENVVTTSLSTPSATPTTIVFVTASVFTSGNITSTVTETESSVVTPTPTPSPVSVTAATAKPVTTSKSSATQLGWSVLPVLGALGVGALML